MPQFPVTDVYFNTATLMETPTDQVLVAVRAAGFAGIEARIERLETHPQETATTAALAEPGEILSLNGLTLPMDAEGRLDDAALAEQLAVRLAICTRLHAPWLLVVPPRLPGVGLAQALAEVRRVLPGIVGEAKAHGVRIAFEFLGFHDCPINRLDLAMQAVAGQDEVGLVIDSCHWYASGQVLPVALTAARIAMVHLNDVPAGLVPDHVEDADRLLPGQGVIPLATLVGELRARGYRGPWSLETFNPAHWRLPPAQLACEAMTSLRSLLDAPAGAAA